MDTLKTHIESDFQRPPDRRCEDREAKAGATLLREGAAALGPYVLREGWAFRYKTLPDGRRQILAFFLPGDIIGFQAALFPALDHGVEALTAQALVRSASSFVPIGNTLLLRG